MTLKDTGKLITAALLLTTMTGCVLQERYHFTEEASAASRNAVQNIMASQALNPYASEDNHNSVLTGEDGAFAAESLSQYRTGSSGESNSNNSITLDLDN